MFLMFISIKQVWSMNNRDSPLIPFEINADFNLSHVDTDSSSFKYGNNASNVCIGEQL